MPEQKKVILQNSYVKCCVISCRKAIRIRTARHKETWSRTEGCVRYVAALNESVICVTCPCFPQAGALTTV
jgi:hypothetical protein